MSDDEQNVTSSNLSPHITENNADVSSTLELEGRKNNHEEDEPEAEWIDEDDQEESFSDESDELSENKYEVDNQGIAAVGDNAHVNINYYIQIVKESRQRIADDDDRTKNNVLGRNELIERALSFVRQSGTFPVNPINKTNTSSTQLPTDEEQLSKWYYKLDKYEQCYVLAAAILHGAPANEVSKRADILYMPVIDLDSQQNDSLQLQTESFRVLSHNRSSRDLQTKTYTITQRIEGVERLFWRDVDVYGISSFGLRLLDFLAGEFMNKGASGQIFLEKLQDWSQERHQETSWRSARALGVFLWRRNVDELRQVAISWAKSRSQIGWRRTAMLLDGAYEIDSIKYPDKAINAKISPVLQLLNEWVRRSQKMQHATDGYIGCAAAHTFGLMGKRKPEIALRDLDQLLSLSSSQSTLEMNALFASIESAYVSLSWSGHIKNVLMHLADAAEQSVLQRALPQKKSERYTYCKQCEVKLNISLEAFFLITADSLSDTSPRTSIIYDSSLLDQATLPDPLGQDVILAGLLTPDDCGWRQQVITLISSGIIERQNRPLAFDVIQQWAETLLSMQQEEQSDEAQRFVTLFKNFMVDVGKTIDLWCLDLKKRQRSSYSANIIYKNRLEQWHKRERMIGQLSHDVLSQLNS